jgi:hypothetical protein
MYPRGHQAASGVQTFFDQAHGGEQLVLLFRRQTAQHCGYLPIGTGFQWPERALPFGCKGEEALAPICTRSLAPEELLLLQLGQGPAQVSRVQSKLCDQVRRCRLPAMGNLVENAHLRERKRAAHVVLQQSDLFRVEAIKVPDIADGLAGGRGSRHRTPRKFSFVSIQQNSWMCQNRHLRVDRR